MSWGSSFAPSPAARELAAAPESEVVVVGIVVVVDGMTVFSMDDRSGLSAARMTTDLRVPIAEPVAAVPGLT